MTLPFDLENNLAGVGLTGQPTDITTQQAAAHNAAHRHLISFRYPAAELIAPGDEELLHLDNPSHIKQRPRPLAREVQPSDFNTSFFCALPLSSRAVSSQIEYESYRSLMRAVLRLQTSEGSSTLSLVRLATPERCLHSKTRIRIDSVLEGGLFLREEFELHEGSWENLMQLAARTQWIGVLKNLVYRESDRAWYHVEDALESIWDWQDILQHQNAMGALWNTKPPRTAKELLRQRIYDINAHREIDFSNVRPGGFGSAETRLPCGCLDGMNTFEWDQFTNETSLEETCPTCGNLILQPDDYVELGIDKQRRELQLWLQKDKLWRDLDNADFSLRTEALQIKAGTFYHVLHAALTSMKNHKLVCPSSLAFVNLAEARVGLQALEAFLYGSDEMLSGTAAQIVDNLFQKVKNTSIDSKDKLTLGQINAVPGFWDCFKMLLVRAMNFWLRRNCRRVDGTHWRVHLHDGVPFISPSSYEASEKNTAFLEDPVAAVAQDANRKEDVSSMDSLLGAMGV